MTAAQRIRDSIDRAEKDAMRRLNGVPMVGCVGLHAEPLAVLRRCAADRRVLERHQRVVETVEWWDCSDGTGVAAVCACCGNREPNEWDLGVGNYGAKPEGWVSPYVLWPCDDILDLADRWGVEIRDQT